VTCRHDFLFGGVVPDALKHLQYFLPTMCANSHNTSIYINCSLPFLPVEHIPWQRELRRRKIFFSLVAQCACFPFLHDAEGLCDLTRAYKPLQLCESFKEGDPRLDTCFHRFLLSGAHQHLVGFLLHEVNEKMCESLRSQRGVLSALSYEEHGLRSRTISSMRLFKYTLFFTEMQYL
jgi:hypothetical protein